MNPDHFFALGNTGRLFSPFRNKRTDRLIEKIINKYIDGENNRYLQLYTQLLLSFDLKISPVVYKSFPVLSDQQSKRLDYDTMKLRMKTVNYRS